MFSDAGIVLDGRAALTISRMDCSRTSALAPEARVNIALSSDMVSALSWSLVMMAECASVMLCTGA